MPTVITKTIGATGRDYATYALWKAYVEGRGSLVTVDEQHNGVMYKDGVFTETTFAMPTNTMDATRYASLYCGPGQSFNTNANDLTNALRYNEANGVAMRLSNASTLTVTSNSAFHRVDGIQFLSTGAHTGSFFGTIGAAFTNCIFDLGTATVSTTTVTTANTSFNFKNCVFVGAIAGRVWATNTNATSGLFDSCSLIKTVTSTVVAITGLSTSSRIIVRNCAVFGQGTMNLGSSNVAGPTFTTNATDGTLNIGTGAGGLVGSNNFQNVASAATLDLRSKAGGSIIGAGTASVATDILGQTRASPPTIGSHEYVTTAAGTARRAIYNAGGKDAQVPTALLGTGLKPYVYLNGVVKERATTEGVPVVLINGVWSTLPTGDTLEI